MTDERGFALLIAMGLLVPLGLLALMFASAAGGDVRLAWALQSGQEIRAAADGAIEEAAFHLLDRSLRGWQADGAEHVLHRGAITIRVRVSDEADRVNLNTASAPLLAALVETTGLGPGAAASRAQAIIEWRARGPRPLALKLADYRAAGRSFAPPEEPFRSIDELSDVLGLDAPLLAALRPHLTVFSGYGPTRNSPDAAVAHAVEEVGRTGGELPSDERFGAPRVLRVRAEAHGPGSLAALRTAILRLDPAARSRPVQPVRWSGE